MSLKDQIRDDLKDAMRQQDELRRTVLRSALTAVTLAEKSVGKEQSDEQIQEAIGREAKKRREAADQYEKAGHPDRARRELDELKILEGYLPRQLSEEEIEGVVDEVIGSLGVAGDSSKMGQVMGQVMGRVKGRADGKLVNRIVRERLG